MDRQGNQLYSIADITVKFNEFPVVFFLLLNPPEFLHTGESVQMTMAAHHRGKVLEQTGS